MTPEQIQALLEYSGNQGAWSEQDRAIQQQLAQANLLRNKQMEKHTTGAGSFLGGLGDILGTVRGELGAKQARGQDLALQQAHIDAIRKLAAAYGGGQQPMAGGAPYPEGF